MLVLALLLILLGVWILPALISRTEGAGDWLPHVGTSAYGWLVVASLVFSLVMAKCGFPFVFLVLPPIFFISWPGSKSR